MSLSHLPHQPSLEQQRKRAKDLCRAAKKGDPEALTRFTTARPSAVDPASARPPSPARNPERVKLSDAQFVIARELGFLSWPKLRLHVLELERLSNAIRDGAAPPDGEMETIHLRCGADLREGLSKAGFAGEFFEYSDPICQGPVPADPRDFLATRVRFLTEAYGADSADVSRRLEAEAQGLEGMRGADRVVLWFEHDPYDQLILARVLAHFATGLRPRCLELICVDEFPGVGRFVGLGQLTAPALRGLWPKRFPVTRRLLDFGSSVFRALSLDDPTELMALSDQAPTSLRAMGPSIIRHLEELPDHRTGLSRTQAQTLEALQDRNVNGGALFKENQRLDPLPFLGDAMYAAILREMADEPSPLLAAADPEESWIRTLWTLTDLGRNVLSGKADWVDLGGGNRWVGGVRVEGRATEWRWDAEAGGPVRNRS